MPPSYPPLPGLWTRYEGILGPLPDPGSATCPNLCTIAPPIPHDPVDALTPSGAASVGTGYAPGTTTMTLLTGTNLLIAWLHEHLAPQVPPPTGPYGASNGLMATIHSMDLGRLSTDNLLHLRRGGRGTGGSSVSWLLIDVLTGDNIRVRADTSGALTDITPTTIQVPGLLAGTGSKDSWVLIGARWWWVTEDIERGWELLVAYDLDDGAGVQIAYNDIFTETDSVTAPTDNITRVDVSRPTFGGLAWRPSSDQLVFHELICAMLTDAGADGGSWCLAEPSATAKALPVLEPPVAADPLASVPTAAERVVWLAEPDQAQEVLLGGRRVQVRLRWMERTRGWYVSVFDRDGRALLGARRLIAGWSPWGSLGLAPGMPAGTMVAREVPLDESEPPDLVHMAWPGLPSEEPPAEPPELVPPQARQIVARLGEPDQVQEVDLDGVRLRVSVRWSDRAAAWIVTLSDEFGVVVGARKLVEGWGPHASIAVAGLPLTGTLVAHRADEDAPDLRFIPLPPRPAPSPLLEVL